MESNPFFAGLSKDNLDYDHFENKMVNVQVCFYWYRA